MTVADLAGNSKPPGGLTMTRTIGAAIGAIIVFLFFVLGLYHPRQVVGEQPAAVMSARR
jgi:hypothetical protein